jgi:hypothetical protein
MRSTKSTMTVLKQAVELIPAYLVSKLASRTMSMSPSSMT